MIIAAAAFCSSGFRLGLREAAAPSALLGPCVAVLPFDSFGDEEVDLLADGLTEDIITRLSLFGDLQVIARNTTFRYKGEAVDIPAVGRDLSADYVLEGSVRRIGDALRITGQLISTSDGTHVWADAYDRPFTVESIFAVRDDVTQSIASSVGGRWGVIGEDRVKGIAFRPALSDYECVLLARRSHRTVDPELFSNG